MLIDELGNGFKRHGFNQCHDHGFKQQRETAAGSSPWNINQPYPTIIAFNPWDSGCQVGFMLKEVQVPPALFLSIIGFYVSLTTFRTGKSASSENRSRCRGACVVDQIQKKTPATAVSNQGPFEKGLCPS